MSHKHHTCYRNNIAAFAVLLLTLVFTVPEPATAELDIKTFGDQANHPTPNDVDTTGACEKVEYVDTVKFDMFDPKLVSEEKKALCYKPYDEVSTFAVDIADNHDIGGGGTLRTTYCDLLIGTEYDDLIVYGSFYYWNWLLAKWVTDGGAAKCTWDSNSTTYNLTSCDALTTGTITFKPYDGDDAVGSTGDDLILCREDSNWWAIGPMADISSSSLREADFVVWGCEGDDWIVGSPQADVLVGGSDDDIIRGRDGIDKICGDWTYYSGDDVPAECGSAYNIASVCRVTDSTTGGEDVIYGEFPGTDYIYPYPGDYIFAGGHNDTVYGDGGNDTVNHGGGDYIAGDGGCDTIYGNNGDDRIWAGEMDTDDYTDNCSSPSYNGIHGGKGDDTIVGSDSIDAIVGYNGDDEIEGYDGADYLWGGIGTDDILGGDGDDWICTGAGAVAMQVYGGADADTICVNTISAGIGEEDIDSDGGDDFICYLGSSAPETIDVYMADGWDCCDNNSVALFNCHDEDTSPCSCSTICPDANCPE